MQIRTILTPAEIAALPAQELSGTVCVVFDVLRATSTIVAALTNGASRVYPVLKVDDAFALQRERLADALLGGEREGVKIDGFDLGNSPREYLAERVAGRDIITTTTNGTVALRACSGAKVVFAAALVNLDATVEWLSVSQSSENALCLVCAGTGNRFALEDGLAAGALAQRLITLGSRNSDDATRAMAALYEHHRRDLQSALQFSENGRRLRAIGLGEDVDWCARDSVLDTVAVWHEGAMHSARNLHP